MKICYFSCSSVYGGVEKIIVDSINELSNRHTCKLIVPNGCAYKNKISKKVNIVEYKSFDKRYNPFLFLEIAKMLTNYDIVHTHGAKATQIAYLLNKFISFLHVATKHNIRKGRVFNKIQNVISVSKEVSKTITHENKTIYFGINQKKLQKINKNEIFTIITIGRLDPIKGFDKLIYEVSKLKFEFILNIVGEGKERKNLQELIKKYGLESKVFLKGFQENIPEILATSHLQVISSLSEGLPLTLLEGLINSSVIISTPVGGIVEVLDNDYLVDINNISKKINHIKENYTKSCGDFERKHLEIKNKFDYNHFIENLENYYQDRMEN